MRCVWFEGLNISNPKEKSCKVDVRVLISWLWEQKTLGIITQTWHAFMLWVSYRPAPHTGQCNNISEAISLNASTEAPNQHTVKNFPSLQRFNLLPTIQALCVISPNALNDHNWHKHLHQNVKHWPFLNPSSHNLPKPTKTTISARQYSSKTLIADPARSSLTPYCTEGEPDDLPVSSLCKNQEKSKVLRCENLSVLNYCWILILVKKEKQSSQIRQKNIWFLHFVPSWTTRQRSLKLSILWPWHC